MMQGCDCGKRIIVGVCALWKVCCAMTTQVVCPGDVVASTNEKISAGEGCMVVGTNIVATRLGTFVIDEGVASVPAPKEQLIPRVGSRVHIRIQRVTRTTALGDIFAIDGSRCRESFKGVIRQDDIRPPKGTEIPLVHESFRPGDTVLAEVVSTTDARQFMLTTRNKGSGVVQATSFGGHPMRALPNTREALQCSVTGTIEQRWVAMAV